MIRSYKESVNSEDLDVKAAVKNTETKKWVFSVKDFLFQTPRIKIIKETGTLIFKLESKKQFFNYLELLEESVCDHLYKNSEKLFNGKKFSKEKILESMTSSWDIDDSGYVYLQPEIKDFNDIKCLDIFNNEISYDDLQEKVTAVIKLNSISFSKTSFKINYIFQLLKMSKVQNILKSNPFDEGDNEQKVEQIPEIYEQSDEITRETQDELDFFD